MTLDWLTFVARTVAMLLVAQMCVRLYRARRSDGPLVNAFTWYFLVNAATMAWYITATLLAFLGLPGLRPYLWDWAWLLWVPMSVTLVRLGRALDRTR